MADPLTYDPVPLRTTDRALRFRVIVRRYDGKRTEASFENAFRAVTCADMWKRMPSTIAAFVVDCEKGKGDA